MPIKTHEISLRDAQMITDKVKHFAFSCDDASINAFTPGQFITMHFEVDGKMLKRSYSLANRENNQGLVEFAASYVKNGPASERLFHLNPNDCIQINGPFGRLVLKDEPVKRYILVATSTGVTPYRAMLNQLKEKLSADSELTVTILQGVQYRRDLLYGDEFLNFANNNERASFYACYSQEDSPLEYFEYKGYCQSKLEALEPNPTDDLVYLCGNPGMIDESFAMLKERNFEIKNIRREKYISR